MIEAVAAFKSVIQLARALAQPRVEYPTVAAFQSSGPGDMDRRRDEDDLPSPASTESDTSSDDLGELSSPALHPPHLLSLDDRARLGLDKAAREAQGRRAAAAVRPSPPSHLLPASVCDRQQQTEAQIT